MTSTSNNILRRHLAKHLEWMLKFIPHTSDEWAYVKVGSVVVAASFQYDTKTRPRQTVILHALTQPTVVILS